MGSGNCLFWAPDTFDLSDDGHAVVRRRRGHRRGAAARSPPKGCPVGAISLWRDGVEVATRERERNADRRHRGPRGAAPHRAALGADALPAQRAPGRGRVDHRRPAGRLGEDGRPGVARPRTCPRPTAARASTLAELAVVLEELGYALLPRAPCCRRCSCPPPWPGHRNAGHVPPDWLRGSGRRLHHRPPWRSAPRPCSPGSRPRTGR